MIGNFYRKSLWNKVKKQDLKVKILDVGAAGESAPIWKNSHGLCDFITVDPFAPDGTVDIPYGLDSDELERELYQTDNPYCSSLYAPNIEYLQTKYNDLHIKQRKIANIKKINTKPGDDYIDLFEGLDFIKIDTQGSEHSILEGMSKTINKHKPIMYLETWLEEVYKNAPKTHQIIELLNKMDYEILYIEVGASWSVDRSNLIKKGRRQSVGMDILAMHKETFDLTQSNSKSLLSKIIILELYGMHSHVERFINYLIDSGCKLSKEYKLNYYSRLRLIPPNWISNILDYFCGNKLSSNRIYPKLYD